MRIFIAIILLFTCAKSMAQVNLILNPSFEQYSNCPGVWDEISYAYSWMSLDSSWGPPDWAHDPAGVPDLCHICADSIGHVGVPNNFAFYHYPRTGNGMAQVQMFYDYESDTTNINWRDYLQGHLKTVLIPEQSYCVTFYVALEQASYYAINHIGAYFDDGTIDTTHNYGLPQTQYTPQILDTTIILDTVPIAVPYWTTWTGKWVRVQGSFTAHGNERLITIGNFTDMAHTNFIALQDTTGIHLRGGVYSWYLVDDISVIKSDAIAKAGPDKVIRTITSDSVTIGDTLDTYLPCYWYVNGVVIDSNKGSLRVHPDSTTKYVMALDVCGHITYDTVVVWFGNVGISNLQTELEDVLIYPNPTSDILSIEHAGGCHLAISDMVGRQISYIANLTNKEVLNINYLSKGIYTLQVIDNITGIRIARKIVKE